METDPSPSTSQQISQQVPANRGIGMPSQTFEVPDRRIDMPRSVIRKVSPELRTKSKLPAGSSLYDPVMVSLGPHHHGKPELKQAEEFKKICLHQLFPDQANRLDLHNCILSKIDQVRNSYDDVSLPDQYKYKYDNDSALAEMMLLDACFIIFYMEMIRGTNEENGQEVWNMWRHHLGDAGCKRFAARDIMVLENQIPFFVLKLVMSQKYPNEEWKNVVAKFLDWKLKQIIDIQVKPVQIPRVDQEPLHILAAFRRVLVEKEPNNQPRNQQQSNPSKIKNNKYYTCGSVTDLKAKGIYFEQSSSQCFQDIKFNSYVLYGKLQLPVRYICDGTLVTFSNMIAYEICPRNDSTDLAVCSYISLMKSLIQTPADVKELQEAGVFALNRFANQEEVVEMFKTFDTLDLDNKDIYKDVMSRIGKHSRNKLKTWIAHDLIQTTLRSPCTTIAWLSAVTLFILTCISVYYAMHRKNYKIVYGSTERN